MTIAPSAPSAEPSARPVPVHALADVEGGVWTSICPLTLRSFVRRRNDFLDRCEAMIETTRHRCRIDRGLAG